ncbi:MAG: efflux RND transporter periplasmic adaptor subunit [Nitrospiraceae bacterium]|nr:efflux RND transporter periplasmic adaptor subunit [Nitrospiraceae bacterium]
MTTGKKTLVLFALLALVGGTLAFIFSDGRSKAPKFRTQTATRGVIEATVTATGTVNPVTTVLVGTQVSGTIKKIYADFNSVVRKGQMLALIDPTTFEAQLNEARANYISAKAELDKTVSTEVDARRTMLRNKDLLSKNLIAQSDFDTAETSYLTAKASVEAARGQVSQTEAAMNFAQTNLRYTRIISPVDGTVVARNVDVGQTVAASFQTPTLFSVARDLRKMQIDTSVDEADIGSVKTGQDVEFTVDAYPDITFRGKVSQVRINPTIVQNVVTYDVVVQVDNTDLKLKPGMTANVTVITDIRRDALRVPNAALRFSMPESFYAGKPVKNKKYGPGVWVLENEMPRRVAIKTGLTDGNYTEVVSGDLAEGAKVIVETLGKEGGKQPRFGPRMIL